MLKPVTEVEQDYAYSQGFLESWFDGDPKTPQQIKDHLKILTDGIKAYREKYVSIQEDYRRLQENYNTLTATSSQYLQLMSQQKEQIDQLLLEDQRQFHKRIEGTIDV